jgi:hypothetical protein
MLVNRGVVVVHTMVFRRFQHCTPELEKRSGFTCIRAMTHSRPMSAR